MKRLLFDLVRHSAERFPHADALSDRNRTLSYEAFCVEAECFSRGLLSAGLARLDRVGVYLPNRIEAAIAMFGAAHAGCVFVPINPALMPYQVEHILRDCGVRALVTSPDRLGALLATVRTCSDLRDVVLVGRETALSCPPYISLSTWEELLSASNHNGTHRVIDADPVSIFYTSGSTGRPKGVTLSHRNMVSGAEAVAEYLGNGRADSLLGVLPVSFDYGFSQLSTAIHVGAKVTMLDYLLPRDVMDHVVNDRISGLAGVPSMWNQLANLRWAVEAQESLRYITNSGGSMPLNTLRKLRAQLPRTQVFLMYGLTEAFRSTYLPPEELCRRPGSIGKAIPNAEILVVRPDGSQCAPNEPGELVHRGASVALGYWNDPAATAERFRPISTGTEPRLGGEVAVWSGDTVRMDEDGFLYFVGRRDDMIKTSGYRVSPTEVEEVIFGTGQVSEAAAVGVPHCDIGQAIVVAAVPACSTERDSNRLLELCRRELPAFMVPKAIHWRDSLPRNPNGKYDRKRLADELAALYFAPEALWP